MTPDRSPQTLLPLTAVAFEILLTLADGDCHGYHIMQEVERRTSGAITLHPGTLYRALARLLEQDLLGEVAEDEVHPYKEDIRRRYYRLTRFGRAVLVAEAARLEQQVREARARRLSRKTGTLTVRRWTGLLLRVYPAGFRRRFGAAMQQAFLDGVDRARTSGQRFRTIRFVIRASVDALGAGVAERIYARRQDLRSRRTDRRLDREVPAVEPRTGVTTLAVTRPAGSPARRPRDAPPAHPHAAVDDDDRDRHRRHVGNLQSRGRCPAAAASVSACRRDRERRGDVRRSSLHGLVRQRRRLEIALAHARRLDAAAIAKRQPDGRRPAGPAPRRLHHQRLLHRRRRAAVDWQALLPEDDRPGAAPVAVLEHSTWQLRFGGDPAIVGRSLSLNNTPVQVVGVMPESFHLPFDDIEVWLPIAQFTGGLSRDQRSLFAMGRLQAGRRFRHRS